MKRVLKIIALALVIAMLSVSLCSCDEIDKMRTQHAAWIEPDESFTLGGETYRRVTNITYFDLTATERAYLTDSDVPLLLMKDYGKAFNINHEHGTAMYNRRIYAAERVYDYASSTLSGDSKALSSYGITRMVNGEWQFFPVSELLAKSLGDMVEDIKGYKLTYEKSFSESDLKRSIDFNPCDTKGMFKTDDHVLTVYYSGSNYYLKLPGKGVVYKLDAKTKRLFDEYLVQIRTAGVVNEWQEIWSLL